MTKTWMNGGSTYESDEDNGHVFTIKFIIMSTCIYSKDGFVEGDHYDYS